MLSLYHISMTERNVKQAEKCYSFLEPIAMLFREGFVALSKFLTNIHADRFLTCRHFATKRVAVSEVSLVVISGPVSGWCFPGIAAEYLAEMAGA